MAIARVGGSDIAANEDADANADAELFQPQHVTHLARAAGLPEPRSYAQYGAEADMILAQLQAVLSHEDVRVEQAGSAAGQKAFVTGRNVSLTPAAPSQAWPRYNGPR